MFVHVCVCVHMDRHAHWCAHANAINIVCVHRAYVCQIWYEERANMIYPNDHSVRKSNNQPTNDSEQTDQTVFYLWTHYIARARVRAFARSLAHTHCTHTLWVWIHVERFVRALIPYYTRTHTHQLVIRANTSRMWVCVRVYSNESFKEWSETIRNETNRKAKTRQGNTKRARVCERCRSHALCVNGKETASLIC